jgi:hypothetical protein
MWAADGSCGQSVPFTSTQRLCGGHARRVPGAGLLRIDSSSPAGCLPNSFRNDQRRVGLRDLGAAD